MPAKPVKTFRLGQVSISVFKNGGFYKAAPQVSYKKDGERKYSTQFSSMELAAMSQLAQVAWRWIAEQEAKEVESRLGGGKPPAMSTKQWASQQPIPDEDTPF